MPVASVVLVVLVPIARELSPEATALFPIATESVPVALGGVVNVPFSFIELSLILLCAESSKDPLITTSPPNTATPEAVAPPSVTPPMVPDTNKCVSWFTPTSEPIET